MDTTTACTKQDTSCNLFYEKGSKSSKSAPRPWEPVSVAQNGLKDDYTTLLHRDAHLFVS